MLENPRSHKRIEFIDFLLKKCSWHKIYEDENCQKWQHTESADVGEYKININSNYFIDIDYSDLISPSFNCNFLNSKDFMKHINKITNNYIIRDEVRYALPRDEVRYASPKDKVTYSSPKLR